MRLTLEVPRWLTNFKKQSCIDSFQSVVHRWPRNGELQKDGKELLETLAPLVDSGRMIEARTAAACAAIAAAAGVQRCVTEDGQVYFAINGATSWDEPDEYRVMNQARCPLLVTKRHI